MSRRSLRRPLAVAAALLVTLVAPVVSSVSAQAATSAKGVVSDWGTDGSVYAILPVGDRVYIGGKFSNVIDPAGVSHPASNVAVYLRSQGAFDLSFAASTDNVVTSLAVSDTRLFLGGDFTTVGGVARVRIASVDASTGAVITAFKANANKIVDALQVSGGWLYVGGNFGTINNGTSSTTRKYLARLDPTTGAVDSWAPTPDARVRSLSPSPDGTRMYLAGDFQSVNGVTSQDFVGSVSTSTGAVSSGFVPGNTSPYGHQNVLAVVATTDNRILLATAGYQGGCTSMNATTGAQQWTKGTNGNAQAISYIGNVVWCGGHFTGTGAIAGLTRYKLANLDLTTGAVLSFSARINSPLGVWALATSPDLSRTFMGGDFTLIDGATANHFVAILDGTVRTAPSAPQGPVAVGGDAQVTLTWSAPSSDGNAPVTGYTVYRSSGGAPFEVVGTTGTTRQFIDTTVVNDTTYSYYVTAQNAIGTSPASATVDATPKAFVHGAPSAPTSLTGLGSTTQVSLSWQPPSDLGTDPLSGYRVYRSSTSGVAGTLVGSTSATTTSYVDTTVTASSEYFYTVTAYSAAGESPTSTELQVVASATVPGAPVATKGGSWWTAVINWTPPASDGGSPITSYQVLKNGTVVATVSSATRSWSTSYFGSFTLQVRAVNAIGAGAVSNTISF